MMFYVVQSARHEIGKFYTNILHNIRESPGSSFYFQIYGCQTQINPGQATKITQITKVFLIGNS